MPAGRGRGCGRAGGSPPASCRPVPVPMHHLSRSAPRAWQISASRPKGENPRRGSSQRGRSVSVRLGRSRPLGVRAADRLASRLFRATRSHGRSPRPMSSAVTAGSIPVRPHRGSPSGIDPAAPGRNGSARTPTGIGPAHADPDRCRQHRPRMMNNRFDTVSHRGCRGDIAVSRHDDEAQYRRLDEVSRPDLGQPHDQDATRRTITLGGDAESFRAPSSRWPDRVPDILNAVLVLVPRPRAGVVRSPLPVRSASRPTGRGRKPRSGCAAPARRGAAGRRGRHA